MKRLDLSLFRCQNSASHGMRERAESSGGPLVEVPLRGPAPTSQRSSGRECSGFSGLPGGNRNNNGNFNNAGNNGYWWSSSPNNSNAWNRKLNSNNDNVNRNNNNQRNGFSVRCVRDDSGNTGPAARSCAAVGPFLNRADAA